MSFIFNYFIDRIYNEKLYRLIQVKKIQAILKSSFQKWAKKTIQEQGGLPPNAWLDFKKGFKKGAMKTCKADRKNKSKSRKNN